MKVSPISYNCSCNNFAAQQQASTSVPSILPPEEKEVNEFHIKKLKTVLKTIFSIILAFDIIYMTLIKKFKS